MSAMIVHSRIQPLLACMLLVVACNGCGSPTAPCVTNAPASEDWAIQSDPLFTYRLPPGYVDGTADGREGIIAWWERGDDVIALSAIRTGTVTSADAQRESVVTCSMSIKGKQAVMTTYRMDDLLFLETRWDADIYTGYQLLLTSRSRTENGRDTAIAVAKSLTLAD